MIFNKLKLQNKRKYRVRKKIKGISEKPRLCLRLSNKHIHAQCIDDNKGITLCYLSSQNKTLRKKNILPNKIGSRLFGEIFGQIMQKKGIKKISFDRGCKKFHGKIKSFAESIRNLGVYF